MYDKNTILLYTAISFNCAGKQFFEEFKNLLKLIY